MKERMREGERQHPSNPSSHSVCFLDRTAMAVIDTPRVMIISSNRAVSPPDYVSTFVTMQTCSIKVSSRSDIACPTRLARCHNLPSGCSEILDQ